MTAPLPDGANPIPIRAVPPDPPQPPAGPSRRRHRWVSAGLIASLILNAFLIGAVARSRALIGPGYDDGERRVLRTFDRDDRRLARERLRDLRPVLREAREEVWTAGQRVRETLTAPRLDAAALDADLSRLQDLRCSATGKVHDVIRDLAPRLSPRSRQALSRFPLHRW